MSQWESYLQHFGIFGMKWGIRRYQNEDGTLTEEGKKRYSKNEVDDDFKKSLSDKQSVSDRARTNGRKLNDMANELGNEYSEAYRKMKLSSKSKQNIWDNLYKDFGVGCDDEELFEMVASDYVLREMEKSLPKRIKDHRAKFDKAQEDYWNDIHTLTDELKSKYEKAEIRDLPNQSLGRSYISQLIDDEFNTGWNSYLYRHFDDYWVYDNGLYNESDRILKDFTMEKYNKRFGKS